MKHFGRQVLGLITIAHPPRDIRIHQFKVMFVQVTEARGIALRRFDQAPLFRLSVSTRASIHCRFTAGHHSSMYINFVGGKRLRAYPQKPQATPESSYFPFFLFIFIRHLPLGTSV